MTGILKGKEEFYTHGAERHVKMEADWNGTVKSHGMPSINGNYRKLGEREGTDFPEGTNPTDTWISDFWLPEM